MAYEDQDQKPSTWDSIAKSIDGKYLVVIFVVICAFIYLTNIGTELSLQKNALNMTSTDQLTLYYQQREAEQNKKLGYYIGGGVLVVFLIFMAKWKKTPGVINYLEACDIVLATIRTMQLKRKTYPNDLPDGKVFLTVGSDLRRMPADWNEAFLWEVGFCIQEDNGTMHYYTGKVNPSRGDARMVGFVEKYDKRFIGDEMYRDIVPVAIDKYDKWRKYMDDLKLASQRNLDK